MEPRVPRELCRWGQDMCQMPRSFVQQIINSKLTFNLKFRFEIWGEPLRNETRRQFFYLTFEI